MKTINYEELCSKIVTSVSDTTKNLDKNLINSCANLLASHTFSKQEIYFKLLESTFSTPSDNTSEQITNGSHEVMPTPPLFKAIYTKNIETVKLLIEAGADINAKALSGWTALHFALSCLSHKQSDLIIGLQIVKLLLDNGADINIEDQFFPAPLVVAIADISFNQVVSSPTSNWIIENMLAFGKAEDKILNEALQIATECANTALMQILVNYGAEYSTVDIENLEFTSSDSNKQGQALDLLRAWQQIELFESGNNDRDELAKIVSNDIFCQNLYNSEIVANLIRDVTRSNVNIGWILSNYRNIVEANKLYFYILNDNKFAAEFLKYGNNLFQPIEDDDFFALSPNKRVEKLKEFISYAKEKTEIFDNVINEAIWNLGLGNACFMLPEDIQTIIMMGVTEDA